MVAVERHQIAKADTVETETAAAGRSDRTCMRGLW